jgi:hypothetical protein
MNIFDNFSSRYRVSPTFLTISIAHVIIIFNKFYRLTMYTLICSYRYVHSATLFALTGTYTLSHYLLLPVRTLCHIITCGCRILLSIFTTEHRIFAYSYTLLYIFLIFIFYMLIHYIKPLFISLTYSHCILTPVIPVSHLFRFHLLLVVLLCQLTHCTFLM